MRNLFFLLFYLSSSLLLAQTPLRIAIVNDERPDNAMEIQYEKTLQNEMNILLQNRYDIRIKMYYGDADGSTIANSFATAYADNDIVIGSGSDASNYAISLKNYPKPTIASIVLDAQLQGLTKTDQGSSGIDNFTYIESPFDIKRDLNLLYEIYPFDHLEVISDNQVGENVAFLKQLFTKYLDGKSVKVDQLLYNDNFEEHLVTNEGEKKAVYALPYFGKDTSRVNSVFQFINENKIPSAALFGEPYLEAGAMVGYETTDNLQKIPRRIALTVMKIIEGEQAADLSVEMQTFGENLMINMETARQIGIYPSFDIMAEATLIKLDDVQTDNVLTLQKAIAHALQNNLNIKIEEADVGIADLEIDVARSDLYPQVDVSSLFSVTDELTAFSRQGAQGRANWLLSGSLSQVVFSEPLLANIAIQKMLKASEEQQLLQAQLDVVIDVTNAYMNILFAKNNLNIQQQNVERNKENYDISKAKEAIGYIGVSDINRWEAELANANIELNNAFASLRQAKFQLNQLLDRPINEAIKTTETTIEESKLIFADQRMVLINDYGSLDKLSNFLVDYSKESLPELAQIDLGIKVQERLQLSRERALYLPSLAVTGSANRVLSRYDIPEGLPSVDKATTWDIGLGLSYPIFQGMRRKKLVEQSKISVIQLQHTQKNTENQLELLIRANLENVAASFSRMQLAETASEASQKNFVIIQDAYSAGQSNVTTVIDAQNNALASELTAINAVYIFIQDFLNLERSIGYFNFLATPAEKDVFFQEIQEYFN